MRKNILYMQQSFKKIAGIPTIKISVGGKSLVALIDTGASECHIDSSIAATLKLVLEENSKPYFGVAGEGESLGQTKVEFSIGKSVFKHTFIITDLEKGFSAFVCAKRNLPSCILGSSFLSHNGIIIDYRNEIIYMLS